jgi:hypothetical protein
MEADIDNWILETGLRWGYQCVMTNQEDWTTVRFRQFLVTRFAEAE